MTIKQLLLISALCTFSAQATEKEKLSEEYSVPFFETLLRSSEEPFKKSDYFHYVEKFNNIEKFDNSFVRIESRIGIYHVYSELPIIKGMYSIYDDYTNEPLGYLTYKNLRWTNDSNDYYIEQLHINPKYRYKKIGKLLLTFALEKFKEKKIKTLRLVAIPYNENEMTESDLIKYYEKFRFKKSGAIMHLQLDNNIASKL